MPTVGHFDSLNHHDHSHGSGCLRHLYSVLETNFHHPVWSCYGWSSIIYSGNSTLLTDWLQFHLKTTRTYCSCDLSYLIWQMIKKHWYSSFTYIANASVLIHALRNCLEVSCWSWSSWSSVHLTSCAFTKHHLGNELSFYHQIFHSARSSQ